MPEWKQRGDPIPVLPLCHTARSNAHKFDGVKEPCASLKANHLVEYYDSGKFEYKHTCGALFLKSEIDEINKCETKCPGCGGGRIDVKTRFNQLQNPKGGLKVNIISNG